MHIVIFGATGVTGRSLVEQALDQGYDVTAFARNPAFVTTQHARLSIVKGDVFDPATVQEAVANQDAVLCTIGGHDRLRVALSGHPRMSGLCTIGTRNILDAMKTFGVSRLICLSAWGIGDSKGRVPFIFRNVIFPLLMKEEYDDKEAQEQLIQQSPLDWTIVRPARLTNGPYIGRYQMKSSLAFSLQSSISRADVADCMLKQLTDQTFQHKCIELSY
ncbi:MAG TPA: SDR family oxidoreductase [Ktedonosporobacter sp.]|nr:SDR family oxidoreductase [Ktedonosporobacter sp.]